MYVKPKSSFTVSGLRFSVARHHAYFGYFWESAVAQTNRLFWDAWVKAYSLTGSFVMDGASGGVFRWGVNGGQIYNTGEVSFDYDGESVPLGQVHHTAVGLGTDEGGNLVIGTFLNGVLCKLTPFSGTRTSRSGGTYGHLLLGNTESNTCDVTLFQVRGWEHSNPLGDTTAHRPFIPERFFSADAGLNTVTPDSLPQFLVDFSSQRRIIPDLSPFGFRGLNAAGTEVHHPGSLFRSQVTLEIGDNRRPTDYPLPLWEATTNHPWTRTGAPPTPTPLRSLVAPGTPGSARVFDSYSREDSTFAFQNAPGLASTETGSQGVQTWTQKTTPANAAPTMGSIFGVQGGRAVVIWAERGVAYVETNSATMDVRADRKVSSGNRGYCGLAARVSDGANFISATAKYDAAGSGTLEIGKWVAGVFTSLWSLGGQAKGSWTTMRLVCSGNNISMYLDGALQQTVVDAFNNTATKAGIYIGGTDAAECNARFDNFTVI